MARGDLEAHLAEHGERTGGGPFHNEPQDVVVGGDGRDRVSRERDPDVAVEVCGVDVVTYQPSMATKCYLKAIVRPDRLEPPAGPEPPRITIRWQLAPPHEEFRIDYADPNVSVHYGWHRDDDHPEYGDVRFQYRHPERETPHYETTFDASAPASILWEALGRLFDVIPSIVAPQYES